MRLYANQLLHLARRMTCLCLMGGIAGMMAASVADAGVSYGPLKVMDISKKAKKEEDPVRFYTLTKPQQVAYWFIINGDSYAADGKFENAPKELIEVYVSEYKRNAHAARCLKGFSQQEAIHKSMSKIFRFRKGEGIQMMDAYCAEIERCTHVSGTLLNIDTQNSDSITVAKWIRKNGHRFSARVEYENAVAPLVGNYIYDFERRLKQAEDVEMEDKLKSIYPAMKKLYAFDSFKEFRVVSKALVCKPIKMIVKVAKHQ